MSRDEQQHDLSRRTFIKGAGVTASAAALGVGAVGSTSAHAGFHTRFANPRVREAAKVWQSKPWRTGYRGRPDRTVALDDSGIDIRHPDLSPWNGVTAIARDTDGSDSTPEVDLATEGALEAWDEGRRQVLEEQSQTAILGPGTTIEGSETTFPPFTPSAGEGIVQLDAELSWVPENQEFRVVTVLGYSQAGEDQSFRIEINVGTVENPQWRTLQTIDSFQNPEKLTRVPVVPGVQHRFVAGQFANVAAEGTVSWRYYTFDTDLSTLADTEDVVFGDTADGETPKTVGWFDAGDRYGQTFAPEDPNAHGTHVSSIMVGSGQASAIDADRYTEDDPHAILTAGDVISYEVEAEPDTGVFGVATGEGIEVLIEGPEGRELRSSGVTALVGGDKEALPIDDARVDHPTVDERHPVRNGERQPATYTVRVRPSSGEAAATGQVEEVAVGAFREGGATDGDRSGGDVSMHSGIAPDQSLFGMQGLSGPAAALGLFGDELAPAFNVRAVNMSWGALIPAGGILGGSDEEIDVRNIAENGILTVVAAGNTFGSPTGAPGLADEAVAVTSTNFVDGVAAYSDGGSPYQQDEDGQSAYGKPDLCAPGGSYEAGARAARAESEGYPDGVDDIRDYVNFPGTSMASPYVCGVSALAAQAMEEGAPESIRLPSPKSLHEEHTAAERLKHVLRLKSVLLGTATTPAFTAAPFHRHPVRYVHDGRDAYTGYGRVNPDAAVDAVTRDLFADASVEEDTMSATVSGAVGLDVPDDARAIAGYVEVTDGTLDVSLEHAYYSGGNKGMTKGSPHLDLFVYDAENPGRAGDPNTLASAQGESGSASVSVDVSAERDDPTTPEDETETRTLFVVAKLVNVPGVVNGYDVRSHVDLDLTFAASGALPLPEFEATGARTDDGQAFTQGATNQIDVTLGSINEGVEKVDISDEVPDGWTVLPWGDADTDVRQEGPTTVELGTLTDENVENDAATKTYYVEATGDTGQYDFGPATAEVVETTDDAKFQDTEPADTFGGTDTNTIVGVDQNTAG